MAQTLQPLYGTETAFAGVARLNSLAAGQAVTLGTVDNATLKGLNFRVALAIVLAATGINPVGRLAVFLLESIDDLLWADTIDGDAVGNQAANIRSVRQLRLLVADANSLTVRAVFDLVGQIAGTDAPVMDVPPFWSLLVRNDTGAALAATGHSATYQAFNPQVVAV